MFLEKKIKYPKFLTKPSGDYIVVSQASNLPAPSELFQNLPGRCD